MQIRQQQQQQQQQQEWMKSYFTSVAPAEFWSRGQNPRRHYSLPRVYVLVIVLTKSAPASILFVEAIKFL